MRRRRRRAALGPAAASLAASAGPAVAHAPVPGIEGFYSGLAHVAVEPAILIATLAAMLLMVQDWPERFRRAWPSFAIAVLVGLIAGRGIAGGLPLDIFLLAVALGTAALAALAADRLGPGSAGAVAALSGLLVGAAILPEPGPARDVVVTATGGLLGATLPALVAGGGVDWLRTNSDGPVLRIGIRVAASWVGATALMLLAFLLRPAA